MFERYCKFCIRTTRAHHCLRWPLAAGLILFYVCLIAVEQVQALACRVTRAALRRAVSAGVALCLTVSLLPVSAMAEESKAVAKIGDKSYETFDAAYSAAKTGDIIELLETAVITKTKAWINYSKKKITVKAEGIGEAFRVQDGAYVWFGGMTIESDDYCIIVGASDSSSGANVEIYGGTYKGATSAISVTKGDVKIMGGTFSVEPYEGSYAYTINCIDSAYMSGDADVAIQGGKFYNFDPMNNAAEGAGTNFLIANCISVQDSDGYWNVVDLPTTNQIVSSSEHTVTAKGYGSATITADGEIACAKNAQGDVSNWIAFQITQPEGVDANVAKVFTPNSDGTYHEEALASVLDDGKDYASMWVNIQDQRVFDYKIDWNNDGKIDLVINIDATEATLTHDYKFDEVVAPTGESAGYTKYVCVCGAETTGDPVAAQIGTTLYTTLTEAVASAQGGDTITLLADVSLTEAVNIPSGKTVTLDLDGKIISMEDASGATAAAVKNNGTLTIKDSSTEKTGKITFKTTTPSANNGYASNTISNYGTITIANGTIENTSTGGACYALDNYAGSTATIDGGKLTAAKTAVRIFNWTDGDAAKATLTVAGGEIVSEDGYAINFNMGNSPAAALNISDGIITTNDTDYNLAVYIVNKGSAENLTIDVTGGIFNGNFALNGLTCTTMKDGAVSISGGTFEGVVCYGTPNYGFITGGTFSSDPTDYVTDKYAVIQEGSNYVVTSAATAVTGVTLDKSTLSLATAQSATLKATVTPDDALDQTVTWASSNPAVATVDGNGKVTAVAAGSATITATTVNGKTATCAVTVRTPVYDDGGSYTPPASTTPSTPTVSPSAPSTSPTVSTDTTTNTDGSSTKTETKADGTTVETTTNTDGSTSKTETQKDGTVIQTETKADGSSSTTSTKSEVKENTDGSTTTTTTTTATSTNAAGKTTSSTTVEEKKETATGSTTTTSTTTKEANGTTTKSETKAETVKNADGTETTTSKTETSNSNGSKSTTVVDETGKTTAEVTVSVAAVNSAASASEAVVLPMPEVSATTSTDTAPEVKVSVPANASSVKVEIPVSDMTAGTVAVIVHADGTEEIVRTSTIGENGVKLTVAGDATIKIVDNSKDFGDVPETYALASSIDFMSARGIFEGNSQTTFNPHAETSVAQTLTVLARLSGENFYGEGATTKGTEWGTEMGLHTGNADAAITRGQMAVMMWKLAGGPKSTKTLTAPDADQISADEMEAMMWAVEQGIFKGNVDGTLNPNGNASRAHVAALAERYVNAL